MARMQGFVNQSGSSMSSMKRCPFCDEEIRANAIKCKHCGSMLDDPERAVASGSSEERLGRILAPKFELVGELGRGGMAVVFKAVQKKLKRTIALKVVLPDSNPGKDSLPRFMREAQSVASLNHPNIVSVFDVGDIGGIHFMAMEYLEGKNLHHIIRDEGALDYQRAVRYIAPIADALDYAHRHRVIHRDIKSSNIIITGDGRPVLTDFGIAFSEEDTKLTRTGTLLGTPEYMSPEQALGNQVDGRSDIYGLGIVLYEALAGKVPYTGDTALSVLQSILKETPEPLNGTPAWLEELVLSMIEKTPGNRLPSAELAAVCLREQVSPFDEPEDEPAEEPVGEEKPDEKTAALAVPAEETTNSIGMQGNRAVTKKSSESEDDDRINDQPTIILSTNVKWITSATIALALIAVTAFFLYTGMRDDNPPPRPGTSERTSPADSLLTLAEKYYQSGAVVTPPKQNVIELSKKVKALDAGNEKADSLLAASEQWTARRIDSLIEAGNLSAAGELLESGLSYFPSSDALMQLQESITDETEGNDAEPRAVTMPSLAGMTLEEARNRLRSAGLTLGAVSTIAAPQAHSGKVINQTLQAGRQVTAGTTVGLIVGK